MVGLWVSVSRVLHGCILGDWVPGGKVKTGADDEFQKRTCEGSPWISGTLLRTSCSTLKS